MTGVISSAAQLDRETEEVYRVQVVATETGKITRGLFEGRVNGGKAKWTGNFSGIRIS